MEKRGWQHINGLGATAIKSSCLIALLIACFIACQLASLAQSLPDNSGAATALAPQLKPDTPRLDTFSDPKPAIKKPTGPLQGQIRQDNKMTNTKQGLFGSAGKFFGRAGQGIPGRSRNQLPGKLTNETLQAEVESGIGIIGVRFVMFLGKSPTINRVFPMTPAAEKGIVNDDVIVAVDGVPTAGLSKEEVYDMIVGKPGTPVTLSIQRNGDFQVFNLVRMDLNDITDPFIRRDYMRSM